jgi:hypothetical protein
MSENVFSKLDKLPEFLSSHDLVALGLFPSDDAVYLSRYRGVGPDYVKLERKILYPKSAVITFLEQHLKDGSQKREHK